MCDREHETSQYVRKACFCALSRIGRMYPSLQCDIEPIFERFYRNPRTYNSNLWGLLIGTGRMAQSNAALRQRWLPRWIEACRDEDGKIRWAGVKALGHAACPVGDVVGDGKVEQLCYVMSLHMLFDGGIGLYRRYEERRKERKRMCGFSWVSRKRRMKERREKEKMKRNHVNGKQKNNGASEICEKEGNSDTSIGPVNSNEQSIPSGELKESEIESDNNIEQNSTKDSSLDEKILENERDASVSFSQPEQTKVKSRTTKLDLFPQFKQKMAQTIGNTSEKSDQLASSALSSSSQIKQPCAVRSEAKEAVDEPSGEKEENASKENLTEVKNDAQETKMDSSTSCSAADCAPISLHFSHSATTIDASQVDDLFAPAPKDEEEEEEGEEGELEEEDDDDDEAEDAVDVEGVVVNIDEEIAMDVIGEEGEIMEEIEKDENVSTKSGIEENRQLNLADASDRDNLHINESSSEKGELNETMKTIAFKNHVYNVEDQTNKNNAGCDANKCTETQNESKDIDLTNESDGSKVELCSDKTQENLPQYDQQVVLSPSSTSESVEEDSSKATKRKHSETEEEDIQLKNNNVQRQFQTKSKDNLQPEGHSDSIEPSNSRLLTSPRQHSHSPLEAEIRKKLKQMLEEDSALSLSSNSSSRLSQHPDPLTGSSSGSTNSSLFFSTSPSMYYSSCRRLGFDIDLLPDSSEASISASLFSPSLTEHQTQQWKDEETFLVQYGAAQALSLLLRSNPDRWWEQLTSIFAFLIADRRIAALVKVSVILTYGKLSFYLHKKNPYFGPIHSLLRELSQKQEEIVAEPAMYALVDFALIHKEWFEDVKKMLSERMMAKEEENEKTEKEEENEKEEEIEKVDGADNEIETKKMDEEKKDDSDLMTNSMSSHSDASSDGKANETTSTISSYSVSSGNSTAESTKAQSLPKKIADVFPFPFFSSFSAASTSSLISKNVLDEKDSASEPASVKDGKEKKEVEENESEEKSKKPESEPKANDSSSSSSSNDISSPPSPLQSPSLDIPKPKDSSSTAPSSLSLFSSSSSSFQSDTFLSSASNHSLRLFLKSWCKLISENHRPVLNQCSSVVSPYPTAKSFLPFPGKPPQLPGGYYGRSNFNGQRQYYQSSLPSNSSYPLNFPPLPSSSSSSYSYIRNTPNPRYFRRPYRQQTFRGRGRYINRYGPMSNSSTYRSQYYNQNYSSAQNISPSSSFPPTSSFITPLISQKSVYNIPLPLNSTQNFSIPPQFENPQINPVNMIPDQPSNISSFPPSFPMPRQSSTQSHSPSYAPQVPLPLQSFSPSPLPSSSFSPSSSPSLPLDYPSPSQRNFDSQQYRSNSNSFNSYSQRDTFNSFPQNITDHSSSPSYPSPTFSPSPPALSHSSSDLSFSSIPSSLPSSQPDSSQLYSQQLLPSFNKLSYHSFNPSSSDLVSSQQSQTQTLLPQERQVHIQPNQQLGEYRSFDQPVFGSSSNSFNPSFSASSSSERTISRDITLPFSQSFSFQKEFYLPLQSLLSPSSATSNVALSNQISSTNYQPFRNSLPSSSASLRFQNESLSNFVDSNISSIQSKLPQQHLLADLSVELAQQRFHVTPLPNSSIRSFDSSSSTSQNPPLFETEHLAFQSSGIQNHLHSSSSIPNPNCNLSEATVSRSVSSLPLPPPPPPPSLSSFASFALPSFNSRKQ
ncbi:uncharacterized protein MONOS_7518 [Monocercomonoides exilis]|uniref:uncharacterized protein n=1 Tax=Monocercomonoides exilis TaxID=2049356 RepID=UPI0035599429|nr:hypothetical protein MONOS_7518 [Monocercomonoides exilis]|eukprot:MONOS_7518.1-p1 / transcript=MONOS_7518.1 / gene=MONOS_7518 / organism=Monocercomonoides_exilis_PA203 / gene_product=unspecified product / transcript_product=unspecified product / location=Mono_scaffold00259:1159-6310(-) / protein_length=1674 / sequence_SO=supercontig / SO=protein_coding / is_pseudo=false